MALKLNEKYPGYMNAPSVDYPQGSFKNRTSPTAEDGSYFEEAWANDDQGFKQSILSAAGVTANGQVDKVGSSQYFDALKQVIRSESPTPSQATESVAGIAKVATSTILQAGENNNSFATAKGLKDAGLWPLGVGQTRSSYKTSRLQGVTYTNTTGRSISVNISIQDNSASFVNLMIGGITYNVGDMSASGNGMMLSFIVMNSEIYSISTTSGSLLITEWTEIR